MLGLAYNRKQCEKYDKKTLQLKNRKILERKDYLHQPIEVEGVKALVRTASFVRDTTKKKQIFEHTMQYEHKQ